jgi:hypothetical protein
VIALRASTASIPKCQPLTIQNAILDSLRVCRIITRAFCAFLLCFLAICNPLSTCRRPRPCLLHKPVWGLFSSQTIPRNTRAATSEARLSRQNVCSHNQGRDPRRPARYAAVHSSAARSARRAPSTRGCDRTRTPEVRLQLNLRRQWPFSFRKHAETPWYISMSTLVNQLCAAASRALHFFAGHARPALSRCLCTAAAGPPADLSHQCDGRRTGCRCEL